MTFQHQSLSAITFLLCVGIVWVCICRLNSAESKHRKLVRLRHVTLLLGAVALGLQRVLWGEWPNIGSTVMAACLLIGLILGSPVVDGKHGRREGDKL